MILAHGNLYEDRELVPLREGLAEACVRTMAGPPLKSGVVVEACDELARRVERGDYDRLLAPFLTGLAMDPGQFQAAVGLFRRESLLYKLETELGPELVPLRRPEGGPIRRVRYPLGTLLHIAAGNVDGLPAYSVAEGLLAGNVNILKLPSMDQGASILLLKELTDLESLTVFARAADAVVVWGGDEAVRAARRLADPDTQVISWGHKLSFAYAVPDPPDRDLEALARHVCLTRQLLCSSCQGIFVDTTDMEAVEAVGERFFAALQAENRRHPPADLGLRARAALQVYSMELEETGPRALRSGGVSVVIAPDSRLELSPLAGNCWVKPLPRERIPAALGGKRGYLQTAGLLCPPEERAALGDLLARAGVVRVTEPGEMSRTVPGEAHDGTYPLRAYSRVVELV